MTDHDEKDVDALVKAVGELIEWFEVKENPYSNDVMTVIKRKYAPFSEQKKRVPRFFWTEEAIDEQDGHFLNYQVMQLLPGCWLVNGDTGKAVELEEGYVPLRRMVKEKDFINSPRAEEWVRVIESLRVEVPDGG